MLIMLLSVLGIDLIVSQLGIGPSPPGNDPGLRKLVAGQCACVPHAQDIPTPGAALMMPGQPPLTAHELRNAGGNPGEAG